MRLKHTQRGILGFLGTIGSALIGGLGQKSANDTNVALAQETREFNAAEAQKTRDFQAEMSNSAYQRATADLSKAGLNPMLAYTQGGAGTPGGATASAQAARVENVATSGVQSSLAKAQIENITAQTAATAAQAAKTIEETKNVQLEQYRIESDTNLKRSSTGLNENMQRKVDADIDNLKQLTKNATANYDVILQQAHKLGIDTDLVRELIKTEPFKRDKLFQEIKTEIENTYLTGLRGIHSKLGLDESRASSAFFKEGSVGEQSKTLRLLIDTLKGAAAAGSSWRK